MQEPVDKKHYIAYFLAAAENNASDNRLMQTCRLLYSSSFFCYKLRVAAQNLKKKRNTRVFLLVFAGLQRRQDVAFVVFHQFEGSTGVIILKNVTVVVQQSDFRPFRNHTIMQTDGAARLECAMSRGRG